MNLLFFNKASKLLRRLLLSIGLPIILVILISEIINYQTYRNNYLSEVSLKQQEINQQIKTYYDLQTKGLTLIGDLMTPHLRSLSAQIVSIVDSCKSAATLDLDHVRSTLRMDLQQEDIYIINTNGVVINTTYHDDFQLDLSKVGEKYFDFLEEIRKNKKFASEHFSLEFSTHRARKYTYQASSDGQYIIEIGTYSSKADELIASVSNKIKDLTQNYPFLISADLYVASDKPYSLSRGNSLNDQQKNIISQIFQKRTESRVVSKAGSKHIDYHYMYVKDQNSILYDGYVIEVVVDHSVIDRTLMLQMIYRILFVLSISFAILFITFRILMNEVSAPLDKVNRSLSVLAQGDLDNAGKFNFHKADELEGIGNNLNNFVGQLKRTATFANEIGQGNWESQFELTSSNDSIGLALLDMRDNLKKNDEEKKEREKIEAEILWTTNGLNKFAEILRQDTSNFEEFGSNVISNLVKYVDVNQGALFFLDETEDGQEKYLEQIAAYAYGQSRKIKNRIPLGENLLAACVREKYTIYRTEIPKDYTYITSGLGGALPKSLLIVPLKLNDEVFGAIEMASFYEINKVKIDFVEEIAESISYTLSITKNTIKTNKMAREWERQSEVFIANEQQLRTEISGLKSEYENMALNVRALEVEKDTLSQNLDAAMLQIKQLKEKGRTSGGATN